MSDASENRGKNFKSWRCRDFSTYIYCSQKFNKYGRFLSIITVKGYNRVVIIIPESSYNEGWGLVATKIEEFITNKTSTPGAFITNGGTTEQLLNEKGSFKDALNKSKWTLKEAEVTEVDVVKNQLSVKTQEGDNDLLRRCLVGRFNGGDEVPTRNEVSRWAQQTWKGTQNIQVYDMNGFQYLFPIKESS
ncbi:hypothetical protein KY289_023851 [Solanum tuberosum]|nr:hypothetical protein KY289_023851 [Solanum tuberosum]